MPIFLTSIIGPVLSVVSSIASWLFTSRLGQLLLVGIVAFSYGEHRSNVSWERRSATWQAEVSALQAKHEAAKREIAASSEKRSADNAAVEKALRDQIADLVKTPPEEELKNVAPVKVRGKLVCPPVRCVVGDDLSRRVRQLDATAGAGGSPAGSSN